MAMVLETWGGEKSDGKRCPLTDSVEIRGVTAEETIVEACGIDRVFDIHPDAKVSETARFSMSPCRWQRVRATQWTR